MNKITAILFFDNDNLQWTCALKDKSGGPVVSNLSCLKTKELFTEAFNLSHSVKMLQTYTKLSKIDNSIEKGKMLDSIGKVPEIDFIVLDKKEFLNN